MCQNDIADDWKVKEQTQNSGEDHGSVAYLACCLVRVMKMFISLSFVGQKDVTSKVTFVLFIFPK